MSLMHSRQNTGLFLVKRPKMPKFAQKKFKNICPCFLQIFVLVRKWRHPASWPSIPPSLLDWHPLPHHFLAEPLPPPSLPVTFLAETLPKVASFMDSPLCCALWFRFFFLCLDGMNCCNRNLSGRAVEIECFVAYTYILVHHSSARWQHFFATKNGWGGHPWG